VQRKVTEIENEDIIEEMHDEICSSEDEPHLVATERKSNVRQLALDQNPGLLDSQATQQKSRIPAIVSKTRD